MGYKLVNSYSQSNGNKSGIEGTLDVNPNNFVTGDIFDHSCGYCPEMEVKGIFDVVKNETGLYLFRGESSEFSQYIYILKKPFIGKDYSGTYKGVLGRVNVQTLINRSDGSDNEIAEFLKKCKNNTFEIIEDIANALANKTTVELNLIPY